MLFRNEIFPRDVDAVREILSSTGFFEEAPDEIDVAIELAEKALADEKDYGLAKKLGFDPAVMASPFITTIVDALALLVYFRVATLLVGM